MLVQWWMKQEGACKETCGECWTPSTTTEEPQAESYDSPERDAPPPSDCYDKEFPDVRPCLMTTIIMKHDSDRLPVHDISSTMRVQTAVLALDPM
jgi:hypothetical protein